MKKSENTSELPSILVEKLNRERLESTVVEIEKAIDLLHKNVYLNAILLILILRLRKIFDNEQ